MNYLLDDNILSKEEYIYYLFSGSSQYFLDLLKMFNIDLTCLNIIENSFRVMEKDIEKLKVLIYLMRMYKINIL